MDVLRPGETAYINRSRLTHGQPAIAIRSSPEEIRFVEILDLTDCVLVQSNDGGNPHHAGVRVWVMHKDDLEDTLD